MQEQLMDDRDKDPKKKKKKDFSALQEKAKNIRLTKTVVVFIDRCSCGLSCAGTQERVVLEVPVDSEITDGTRILEDDYEKWSGDNGAKPSDDQPESTFQIAPFKNNIWLSIERSKGVQIGDERTLSEHEMAKEVDVYIRSNPQEFDNLILARMEYIKDKAFARLLLSILNS